MGRRFSVDHASLNRSEAKVLEHFDAGLSPEEIAAATGYSAQFVKKALYYASEADGERQQASIRQGSTNLLAAIRTALQQQGSRPC